MVGWLVRRHDTDRTMLIVRPFTIQLDGDDAVGQVGRGELMRTAISRGDQDGHRALRDTRLLKDRRQPPLALRLCMRTSSMFT